MGEVNRLIAPSAQDMESVTSWLGSLGVDMRIQTDFVTLTANVSQVESLLGVEYYEFQHPSTGFSALRASAEPKLPENVKHAIDFVSPTTQNLPQKLPLRISQNLGETGFKNNPSTLRKMYSIGDVEASSPKNRQAVTGS